MSTRLEDKTWEIKVLGDDMMLSLLDTSVSIDKGLATRTGKITAVLSQPLAVEYKKTHCYV